MSDWPETYPLDDVCPACLDTGTGPGCGLCGKFARLCTCEAMTDVNTVEHFGRCALRRRNRDSGKGTDG